MRLIDADAFKKVLSEHEMQHDKRRSFDDYSRGAASAYEYAGDLLDKAPTIICCGEMDHETLGKIPYMDLRPRPHGEWKTDGTCSECGVYSSLNKNTAYFCPNCGADMRDKKDDLAEIIEAVQSIKEGEQNE